MDEKILFYMKKVSEYCMENEGCKGCPLYHDYFEWCEFKPCAWVFPEKEGDGE